MYTWIAQVNLDGEASSPRTYQTDDEVATFALRLNWRQRLRLLVARKPLWVAVKVMRA